MPAIYRNLQTKCIEIIQFAFMCTICTTLKAGANLQFASGCKFLKHRSHGQKYTQVQICIRVQIAHMNEALDSATPVKNYQ